MVDTDLRNVFSLGYFKTWSLRQSLCRQTSQQTSLDRLHYSLAGFQLNRITKAGYELNE